MGQRTILHTTNHLEAVKITLSQSEHIPLHDHPETEIFCYVVKGKCRIRSYNHAGSTPDGKNLFKLIDDCILAKGDSCAITHDHCNIHEFEAIEDTEFVDVFTPPYPCNKATMQWYQVEPYQEEEGLYVATVIPVESVKLPFILDQREDEFAGL